MEDREGVMVALSGWKCLNVDNLETAPVVTQPFEYLLVRNAINTECQSAIVADFPRIEGRGSYLVSHLRCGPAFQSLVDELLSCEFEKLVQTKFAVQLGGLRKVLTARGYTTSTDGRTHTDLRDKVITVLVYLNPEWKSEGGRLRLLRSQNLEDYVEEISPTIGSLLIFRRCDWSWHGHKPFAGRRLSLQLNWVTSDKFMGPELLRQKIDWFKRLIGIGY